MERALPQRRDLGEHARGEGDGELAVLGHNAGDLIKDYIMQVNKPGKSRNGNFLG